MAQPNRVVVIGAGIAGLSAGSYAAMNGYEVDVFERHSIPGGMCTAWERNGFTFDGCLHWLTGTTAEDSFHQLWRELGAIQGRRIVDHDIFYQFCGRDGRVFSLFTSVDRLEAHMKELAPADNEPIETLCGLIRRMRGFGMPMDKAFELYGPFDYARLMLRMGRYMKDMSFCSAISIGGFADRFTDPLLRESLKISLGDESMTLFSLVVTLSLLDKRAGGFPAGGSLEFARAIERRCLCLGGKVHYGTGVSKVLTRDGRAVGVRLEDGSEIPADQVISAADLKTTLYGMLEGKHLDPQHEALFARSRVFPSSVQVSFGVNMDLAARPHCVGEVFRLGTPLVIGREKQDWLMVKNFCFDPSLSPPGKSVVEAMFMSDDFEYWRDLRQAKASYKAEKERIAAAVTGAIDCFIPGFKSAVEVVDVATPATYARYTGSWKGAFMSWVQTPESAASLRLIRKTVPGLERFWLAGMWVMSPGGVPTGAKTARDVVQMMCRRDGRKFHAEEP
jgi:phytoene dehydrogenase-like protein